LLTLRPQDEASKAVDYLARPVRGQELRWTLSEAARQEGERPLYCRAQTEIAAMTSHIKQDDPDGTAVTRRGAGAHQSFPDQPPTSAANDNVCESSWPLVPFPESACASLLYEEVSAPQAGFRSSWKATLGRLAYVAVVSIAMFGWLYLLWLVLVSSVHAMLS
jgi:hypothetical protein